MSECGCRLCVRGREIEAIKGRRDPDELIRVIDDLMDANAATGEDAYYYRAVMKGEWPGSVAILQRALDRARDKESA